MKSTTITVNVYEIGDVIKLSKDAFKLSMKQRAFGDSRKAMIVNCNIRKDGKVTYKIVTDKKLMMTFTPEDQGTEEYVGHVDMSVLFEKDD